MRFHSSSSCYVLLLIFNPIMLNFDHLLNILLTILLVALSCFSYTSHGACNKADFDSLSSFNSTISASPPLDWSPSVDCCSWEGVDCDSSGKVINLWLPSRGLMGNISSFKANLTSLSQISLSHNWLSGSLPDGFFSSFINLQVLDLSLNRLSGVLSITDKLPVTVKTFNLSGNHFHGTIPSSFLEVALSLEAFDVSNNSFFGSVPSFICNVSSTSIRVLDFSNNDFVGLIPQGFGKCSNMHSLRGGFNAFSGEIPFDIYGLLALQELYFPGNKLFGEINESIVNLINLKILTLSGNGFTGMIPQDIGRLSNLEQLQLHINNLNGSIPNSLTNCTRLTVLNLRVNSLQGELSSFNFSNLVQLKTLDLGNNFFNGTLPTTLFSCKTLTAIRLATNKLIGEFSPEIVALQSLSFLSLSNNSFTNFTSAIRVLTGCKSLSTLALSKNFYDEELPGDESLIASDEFQNLRVLALGGCGFSGAVPLWLEKLTDLEVLDLSYNYLTGSIPSWFGALPNLFYFDLSNNRLSGNFPVEVTRLQRLANKQNSDQINNSYLELPVFVNPNNVSIFQYDILSNLPPAIYLGNNSFNGSIPLEIGQVKFTIALGLSGNDFSGTIPQTLSNLTNLETLDLSKNNLSGEIPSSLQNLNFLSYFSVAYNNLEGNIPTGGQFGTFPSSSFEGNPLLCGRILQRSCSSPPNPTPHSTVKTKIRNKTIIIVTSVICLTILAITLLVYRLFTKRKNDSPENPTSFNSSGVFPEDVHVNDTSLIMFFPNNNSNKTEDLTIVDILKATENFNQANIIGCGGFGLVYKATLPDGTNLAIKKLSGDMGLMEREFEAEVKALSTAQHKNLVTLQGYCIHNGIRLLIYSYMENGSLDYWLHEKPNGPSVLNWPTRLKICQGASYGIAYMHQVCEPHIVHRDLKSSNILLDHNLEAHVADFGLARSILPYHTHVTTELVGTLGYIPPEYSQSWMATLRGDIYSFGVVILEILTGRRPVEVFKPKVARELVTWVQQMRSEGKQEEIFDPMMRGEGFEQEMVKVLDVACMCVNRNPLKRPLIKEVVDWLDDVGSKTEWPIQGQEDDQT